MLAPETLASTWRNDVISNPDRILQNRQTGCYVPSTKFQRRETQWLRVPFREAHRNKELRAR